MEYLMFELGIYIFILGLVVQSIYRIFDPVLHKIFKTKKDEKKVVETSGGVLEDHWFNDNYERKHTKKQKPTSYIDILGPVIIGVLVAWVFLPHTIFDYLPFQPRYPYIAYIITALVVSRIANAEYDSFKTIGEFFIGLVHRIHKY